MQYLHTDNGSQNECYTVLQHWVNKAPSYGKHGKHSRYAGGQIKEGHPYVNSMGLLGSIKKLSTLSGGLHVRVVKFTGFTALVLPLVLQQ